MKLIFVHGWSVTNTNTYGELPEALMNFAPAGLKLSIQHIFLSRYISFHDEVLVQDIARAFEKARVKEIGDGDFSCITHSTGGPVIREWVNQFYGPRKLDKLPLKHLIMLAPANHGSALAQLGKSRVGRIKSWFQGIEPGQGVLNWLELASDPQWNLNKDWLNYRPPSNNFFPFVFSGQSIDHKLYDHLNSYTGEKGSDGVIRVTAANMNYRFVKLVQDVNSVVRKKPKTFRLNIEKDSIRKSRPSPMCVVPDASHSGSKMGIMKSIKQNEVKKRAFIDNIIGALKVKNSAEYDRFAGRMQEVTRATQGTDDKFSMIQFYIHDNHGNDLDDYDILLLAGKKYDPSRLPKGFFVDRQRNKFNHSRLTYYLNHSEMRKIPDGKIGFQVIARPQKGFSYYVPGEFWSENIPFVDLIIANQTLLLEIELQRIVDDNTFIIDPLKQGRKNFKKTKPAGIRD